MSTFPKDLRYTNDHEWLRATGNNWRVGITQFAVDQLGDITLVDLPAEGDLVTKGQRFGTIESVKTLRDLFAPISGKLVEINKDLEAKPELVNEEPYGKGWMVVIEADAGATDSLMDETAYDAHVKSAS